jgi:hypothetical protein
MRAVCLKAVSMPMICQYHQGEVLLCVGDLNVHLVDCMASDGRKISDELERIWKETDVAQSMY